jgi:hypothetical protein
MKPPFPLTPVFMRHAAAPAAREHDSSQSEIAGRGHFTLEFRDTPFESFVRRLERLIDADPAEALRCLKTTLSGRVFSAPRELARLGGKLDETLQKLRDMKPQGPDAALAGPAFAVPALAGTFTREAFALPPAAPEHPGDAPLAPAFAPLRHPFAAPQPGAPLAA